MTELTRLDDWLCYRQDNIGKYPVGQQAPDIIFNKPSFFFFFFFTFKKPFKTHTNSSELTV